MSALQGKAMAVIKAWQQNQPRLSNHHKENHPGKILLWDQPRAYREKSLKPLEIPQLAKHMISYIQSKTAFCQEMPPEKAYLLEEYIELYVHNPAGFPKAEQNPYLSIVRQAGEAVINNSWRSTSLVPSRPSPP